MIIEVFHPCPRSVRRSIRAITFSASLYLLATRYLLHKCKCGPAYAWFVLRCYNTGYWCMMRETTIPLISQPSTDRYRAPRLRRISHGKMQDSSTRYLVMAQERLSHGLSVERQCLHITLLLSTLCNDDERSLCAWKSYRNLVEKWSARDVKNAASRPCHLRANDICPRDRIHGIKSQSTENKPCAHLSTVFVLQELVSPVKALVRTPERPFTDAL